MAAYEFSIDWFAAHIPAWEQILSQWKPARVVEVGSYEGRSATYLIDRAAQQRPVELWCIDTWDGGIVHDPASMGAVELRFDHNMRLAQAGAKYPATVHKMRCRSDDGLAGLLTDGHRESMDLIYIDGSHEAPDVLSDACLAFPLLRVGGVMIFDDYTWFQGSRTDRDPLKMPKPGVDAFLNLFTRKMSLIYGAPISQIYAEKCST
jgi:predicted O-methyltransferase YrrM